MARGIEKHQERLDAINLLGKDLARRAGRRCELCEENDDLRPHDTAPAEEPDLETLLLLCGRCRALTGGRVDDPRTLRFLEGAVWSELPAAAQLARDLLGSVDAQWARDALDLLGE